MKLSGLTGLYRWGCLVSALTRQTSPCDTEHEAARKSSSVKGDIDCAPLLVYIREYEMAQRESRLSRKIQERLRAEGWFCFKVHGNELMMAGLPDIICCAEGLFIGLETKNVETRENTSPRQDYVHSKIRQAKGTAVVVCSPDEAVRAVRDAITKFGR